MRGDSSRMWFSILCAGVLWAFSGCTSKSKVKSISSDDWFRKGVDRFYLATVPSGVLLEGTRTVQVGQDVLVGVGCFAESKNPEEKFAIEEAKCASKRAQIPLNERIRLQDFPMASDPNAPRAGECVLLLGPSELLRRLKERPSEFVSGGVSTAALSAATATNACGMSLALGQAFFLQKTVVTDSIVSEKDSLLFARKLLSYFGENNLVPAMYANDHPVYALKPNTLLQGKNPSQIAESDKLLVGQSVLPCREFKTSVWDMLGLASTRDVRKVFFKALAEADRRASIRVRQSSLFPEFASALQKGDLRAAAGVYNPIFAYEFNRNVEAKAAQGWGGFGVQKFFDEIRTINKELSAL